MGYVHLRLRENNFYAYQGWDVPDVGILGCFFSSDVECFGTKSFRSWALADKTQKDTKWTWTFGGNITKLEDDEDSVLMTLDLPLEEGEEEVVLKISKSQFVHLLDEWDRKVSGLRPQEIIIMERNGTFTLETK